MPPSTQTSRSPRDLDAAALRLLKLLIEHLPQAIPGQPETYLGYKEVHDRLGLRLAGRTYGDSLKRQGLDDLADWTVASHKPAITGLVIDKATARPAAGYFRAHGRSENDHEWWTSQITKAKVFPWDLTLTLAGPEEPLRLGAANRIDRSSTEDAAIRFAAFQHVRALKQTHDHLTSEHLKQGFIYRGQRLPLINPQRGIFKPRQMQYLLSIRTVFPKPGAKVWYDDQREVHRQIYEGDEAVEYAFMGTDPEAADNRWLREAAESNTPIIYFLGIAPGRYEAFVPVFVSGWSGNALRARIVFGDQTQSALRPPDNAVERRYALRTVKQRLHQASFREAVLAAYGTRCAVSGLPEPLLLDAAHIIADSDEDLGHPIVPNGIPLSKVHHAAFDAHLLGIDPDYRVHVATKLLDQNDGPMLESIKSLNGKALRLPGRIQDRPDRDRLAARFELFRAA